MTSIDKNRAVLEHWYDHMWGKTDFDLIPEIALPKYLRHDMTGANNLMPAEDYRDLLKPLLGKVDVQAFKYYLVTEGNYVGALGRFILPGDVQWDWVQLFRVENGRLAETWLPGMGGTNEMGYPHPRNAWTGSEIPADPLPTTADKQAVLDWYQALADHSTTAASLAETVRVHDLLDADRTLSGAQYHQEMRDLMKGGKVSDFQHFLIGEGDMVIATCSWTLDGERQWDWVQAFELADGKIVGTWLPVIGGTDESLSAGPETRWAADAMPLDSVEVPCGD